MQGEQAFNDQPGGGSARQRTRAPAEPPGEDIMEGSEEREFVHQFEKVFELYDQVQPFLDIRDNLRRHVEKKRRWIERLRSPEFPVAFLGAFSAGKSMIINAILGRNILPEATKSYTAIPTVIKRGESDAVIIHYLDEGARRELRNLYVEAICRELHRNPGRFTELENHELLPRLETEIAAHLQDIGVFNKEKFFEELKNLVNKWTRFSDNTREIGLDELNQYVTEDYEDVLLVDRVEVFLREVDLPENVVLVDLPGLGVVNPRHKKITKSYVENEAKAFVVSSAVFKLLEGEEIELLAEIHKARPHVLKRAFWVVNKWETASARQKSEEVRNFAEKVEEHGFRITPERVFKVSALNYLLLKLIETGDLENSGKMGEHLDNLKRSVGRIPPAEEAGAVIAECEETRSFAELRERLFGYLNTTAGREFFDEARGELNDLCRRLAEVLRPHYETAVNSRNLRDSFVARELTRRLREFVAGVKNIVRERIRDIRTQFIPGMVFWNDDKQNDFEGRIHRYLQEIDKRELQNELMRGLDTLENLSRLPQKLEERIPVGGMFRHQLQGLMRADIVDTFSRDLLEDLKRTESLPDEMTRQLEDMLSKRDILMRINGLCDVFLFEYGDQLDQLAFEVGEQLRGAESEPSEPDAMEAVSLLRENPDLTLRYARKLHLVSGEGGLGDALSLKGGQLKTLTGAVMEHQRAASASPKSGGNGYSRHIETALSAYESKIIGFMRALRTRINDYSRRCIKNYFEELETDLVDLFDRKEPEIATVIMEQLTADLDNEIGMELHKQQLYRDAYQYVSELVH